MTLNELIEELQLILKKDNSRGELEVYIYTTPETPNEEPVSIHSIDNSISDRIDINTT